MTKKTPPTNPSFPSVNRADVFQNGDVVNLNKVRKQTQKQEKQRRNKGSASVLSYQLTKQDNQNHEGHKLDPSDTE